MEHVRTVTAGPEDRGERLDRFLAGKLPELSRARVQALLSQGEVRQDGAVIAEGARRVKPGERFAVHLPPPAPARPAAEAIPLAILFEDEHLVVVDKPAGLVVHPAPGHAGGTLVNALLAHCAGSLSGIGGVLRPGIVHRLDKDVSGVMVAAKHDRAHLGLAAQFSVHRIERAYEAIAWGVPPSASGTIDQPIGRHPRDRKRMAVVPGGKRALSRYRLLEAAGTGAARLAVELATGRTHQIRVHLGTLGLGIVGDPVYRPRRNPELSGELRHYIATFKRIALHACRLGFTHPVTDAAMRFERPPPAAFDELFLRLRGEFVPFTRR
jgi:23S rRNA pseudouridine1911/1915/1917 synthase